MIKTEQREILKSHDRLLVVIDKYEISTKIMMDTLEIIGKSMNTNGELARIAISNIRKVFRKKPNKTERGRK